MPTPTTPPTAAELVTFAEIVMIDADEAADIIADDSDQEISDAKWTLTLADIATWSGIVDEGGDVKRVGSIEFFENKTSDIRLEFRNKLRRRYGLAELTPNSFAVASLGWF